MELTVLALLFITVIPQILVMLVATWVLVACKMLWDLSLIHGQMVIKLHSLIKMVAKSIQLTLMILVGMGIL
ncbi:hypothetical protein AMBR_LLDLPDMO_03303 [Lactiplantibacillus plantarum]|nr:hypothetical protein AMBR_LLDLPDMO_03303 [Lactiplantibacillus plantarum]